MNGFLIHCLHVCREEAKKLKSQHRRNEVPLTSDDIPASIKRYYCPTFGFEDLIGFFLILFDVLCEIKHFIKQFQH